MSDIIEIIEHIEKSFNISIENDVAENLVTVDDINKCVLSRLVEAEAEKCLTQVAFYRLKEFLTQEGISIPSDIDVEMNELFPHQVRNQKYSAIIKHNYDWCFPALEFSLIQWVKGKGFKRFKMNQTLREFTAQILALNFHKISNEAGCFTTEEVLKSIKHIISYQLGISVSDINSQHSLTTDLKAD